MQNLPGSIYKLYLKLLTKPGITGFSDIFNMLLLGITKPTFSIYCLNK